MLTLKLLLTNTKANCTERWPAIWSQRISSPRFLVCSTAPIAHTHTVNDGIKLIVIIEPVMGYKKYVVSHALQCCHSGGIVVKHSARSMNNLTLKFDNHGLIVIGVYDDDIAVTDFLTCDFPS